MSNSKKPMRMRAVTVAGGIAILGATGAGMASGANAATTSASTALAKIKYCESGGNYQAQNPTSTASGAYQFLTTTWQGLSASSGYATAASAPAAVQDAAALELYNQAGTSPWAASSSCWSTLSSVPTTSTSSTAATSTTTGSSAASTSTKSTASTATTKTVTSTPTTTTASSATAPAAAKPTAQPSKAGSTETKGQGHTKPAPKPVGSVKQHPGGKHGAKHETPKPPKKDGNPSMHKDAKAPRHQHATAGTQEAAHHKVKAPAEAGVHAPAPMKAAA